MSSSVSTEVWELEADGDSVGKLNWTDFTGLAGGCTARDFTVSMTFRHLATVVEIADWSPVEGVNVAGVNAGSVTEVVVNVDSGLEAAGGGATEGWPMKGKPA